jgi:L-amino acid N-acyltransferase
MYDRAGGKERVMELRDATEADVPGILAIFNEVIANSTAVYIDDPVTEEERRHWLLGRQGQGFPVLVAEDGSGILGFSSFGTYNPRFGYRYTVEHSVFVRADKRGARVGRALITALFPRAAALGVHVMIGGVDAENSASLRLHESLGFIRAAHFHEVGRKFGRWLDVIYLQRWIDAPGAGRP